MLSAETIQVKCQEFREYKRLIEEMEAIRDSIASELKEHLAAIGQDKITCGEYKLSLSTVSRSDVDKTKLQSDYPDIYNQLLKTTSYKRFLVS